MPLLHCQVDQPLRLLAAAADALMRRGRVPTTRTPEGTVQHSCGNSNAVVVFTVGHVHAERNGPTCLPRW